MKTLIEHNYLGVVVICVGSLPCGTDLTGSDMDLTVVVPPDLVLGAGGDKNFLKSILYFLTLESENKRHAIDQQGVVEKYLISQVSFINSSESEASERGRRLAASERSDREKGRGDIGDIN